MNKFDIRIGLLVLTVESGPYDTSLSQTIPASRRGYAGDISAGVVADREKEREMTESNGRDSLRRRIMEGGSDRIAMITGRLQDLPPASLPSFASSSQHHHDSFNDTSFVQRKSVDNEPVQKLSWGWHNIFTAKELSSCITASESTRIFCSILIALLVVLSYVDYPLLGMNIVNSKSIIAAKPLYMLLMTDIMVMVAHLISERRRKFESPEEDVEVVQEKELNWAMAVRILERGLVAHQTIRAIFIDCSLYVVIVLCGLSLI
ncbi:hypothetical protein Ancab_029487 [Ancistrocladus abbreviatus]